MSRRFDFRLARVRRIRELEEHIARTEWGEAQAEANRAAAERNARRAELDSARSELASLLGPGATGGTEDTNPEGVAKPRLDPRTVTLSHDLLDQQIRFARKADEEMLTKQGQADRLAVAWREKDGRRKALERLEGRDRHDHFRELEREDAKELDERSSHSREEDA